MGLDGGPAAVEDMAGLDALDQTKGTDRALERKVVVTNRTCVRPSALDRMLVIGEQGGIHGRFGPWGRRWMAA